jgi:hypothetical protein
MHTISYLGIRCELWSGGNRWFWRISDPRCLRTAVGVAANRAEAVGDARLSIEEMTARVAGHPNLAERTSSMCKPPPCIAAGPAREGWHQMLANLSCYLALLSGECV